ncbi:hypothetical protein K501DRAFT_331235 [Backusella circina FSU 941]|nr:hypothetical protein K501DRAFT_331235 [Backusella circina FSU 941]
MGESSNSSSSKIKLVIDRLKDIAIAQESVGIEVEVGVDLHHQLEDTEEMLNDMTERGLMRSSKKRSKSYDSSDDSSTESSSSEDEKHKSHRKKHKKRHVKSKHHEEEKRNAITGKKLKLKIHKSSKDKEQDHNRSQLLNFLNSAF